MPQTPLNLSAKNPAGALTNTIVDSTGAQLVTSGGLSSALNLSGAAVVKAKAGRIAKISIIAPGSTSGAFTLNDAATIGAASAANEIWSLPYNASSNVAGAVFTLDWPCANGIVVSAIPGAGAPVIAISFS